MNINLRQCANVKDRDGYRGPGWYYGGSGTDGERDDNAEGPFRTRKQAMIDHLVMALLGSNDTWAYEALGRMTEDELDKFLTAQGETWDTAPTGL